MIINKSLVTADKSKISRPNSHSFEYLALSVLRLRPQLKTQRQNESSNINGISQIQSMSY